MRDLSHEVQAPTPDAICDMLTEKVSVVWLRLIEVPYIQDEEAPHLQPIHPHDQGELYYAASAMIYAASPEFLSGLSGERHDQLHDLFIELWEYVTEYVPPAWMTDVNIN